MTEIILVRHGQANSHATDEASYDRLSDLGREQARWLGAHLQNTNPHFDHVITGTLSRQADTAREMGYEITRQDDRLNELSYFALASAIEKQHGLIAPQSPDDYAAHLPKSMAIWAEGNVADVPESFDQFTNRISDTVNEFCGVPGRILIVTSGGVIGMIMRQTLGLETAGLSKMMLTIYNSSFHRLLYVHDQLLVSAFNATPHLDTPDRAHARTYV